jgi:ParB-like chromosome segregation protein Spo0J
MVEAMEASLKAVGLKNPIKVIRISPQKASGISAPTEPQRAIYEIVSGHIRFAGAQKLGWEAIQAYVLDLTPEQALLEAILDNRGQEMTWFDLYESVEALLKVNPKLTKQAVADQLEINPTTVSLATKVMDLLNEGSRRAILQNLQTSADLKGISAISVTRLIDLGDNPALIEKALKVVIAKNLTESQTQELVQWLKNGRNIKDFKPQTEKKGKNPFDSASPRSGQVKGKAKTVKNDQIPPQTASQPQESPIPDNLYLQGLTKGFTVKESASDLQVTFLLPKAQGLAGLYGALSTLEEIKRLQKKPYNPRFQQDLPKLVLEARQAMAKTAYEQHGEIQPVIPSSLSDIGFAAQAAGSKISEGLKKLKAEVFKRQ